MSTTEHANDVETLTAEQRTIFQHIEQTDAHVFVTGRAGTGKSYLLSYLHAQTAKNIVVLAPTGVAPLIAGGQTIHSFFWRTTDASNGGRHGGSHACAPSGAGIAFH